MLGPVPRTVVAVFYLTLFQATHVQQQAQKPGDVVLGGLFLIHYSETGNQCQDFFSIGLGHVEAMVFAIDRINKDPSLLPNVTLGYHIHDYCESAVMAMRYAYEFVRGADTRSQLSSCNNSCVDACLDPKDARNSSAGPIVALIGPTDSGSSVLVGSLLQVASIPVISHSATSDELSSSLYRNFFRTASPDSQQAKVMADVIEHFNWSYVATVATDDSYGRYGVSALEKESEKRGSFCIAFSEYIPRLGYSRKLRRIVQKLKRHSNIRVVILWLFGGYAHNFLKVTNKQSLFDRTWILSDALATEAAITLLPYSKVLQGSLGIQPLDRQDTAFETHLSKLTPESLEASGIPWWREFWKQEYNCSIESATDELKVCPRNMTLSSSSIRKISDTFVPYVTDAIYSIAHALHKMYQCAEPNGLLKKGRCRTFRSTVSPVDLAVYLRNVSFNGFTGKVEYDRFGDPVTSSYEIINIHWEENRRNVDSRVVVGSWEKDRLQLNDSLIKWMSDVGKSSVPLSQCRDKCPAGTVQSSTTPCCWKCNKCPKGMVSSYTGATNCSVCPKEKKPNRESTHCVDLPLVNPSWGTTTSVLLVSLAVLGLIITWLASAVFFKFRNTPIVRASNRELTTILLAAIFMCFVSVIVNLVQPTDLLCRATVIWRMVLFATVISILLLKTMRILNAFQFNVVAQKFNEVRCQTSLVCALVSVEFLFSLLWLLLDPPHVQAVIQPEEHVFHACVLHDSPTGLAFEIIICSHIFLLLVLCTVYAFKARGLPENFNEARYIGLSMYMLLISSIAYYPLELGVQSWYLPIMAGAATMFSSYGLLGCMFAPKIYMILRHPEQNTREAVNIQVSGYNFRWSNNHVHVSPMPTRVSPSPPSVRVSRVSGC